MAGWGYPHGMADAARASWTISLSPMSGVSAMTRLYRRYDGGPTRICSRCNEPKALDAFRLDAKGRARSHCNPCALVVMQEWRGRHRTEHLARRRAADAAARRAQAAERRAVEVPV